MTNFSTGKTYDSAIDFLRVISILAVILIHTTTRHLELTHYDLINNSFTLLLNQISRFAVPLFFMVSGFALEISYREEKYFSYLKRRLSRIFIPYIFWSFVYYYFIYKQHSDNFFNALLYGSASWQLYFIPALFLFYLIFPLLHRFYSLISNRLIFIILGAIELYLLHQDYVTHTFQFPYPIAVALFNYYVFILGMYFSRERERVLKAAKKIILILIPLTIFAAYFVFNEGKTNYLQTYNFEAFYSQWRPSVFIYTVLIGIVLYYFATKFNLSFKKLSNLSFLVFFVHIIFLELLSKYLALNDILFFSATLLLSFLFAYVLHKIRYLAKLIG